MAAPSSASPAPSPTGGVARTARGARDLLWVWALVAWTLFVWVGRVRNALNDPELDDGGRTGPLLLATSFVVLAVLVGVLAWLARSGEAPAWRRLEAGVVVLGAWTTAVWVVRAADIALGGDHEVGFVVVHLVLATVSIALSVAAVVSTRSRSTIRP